MSISLYRRLLQIAQKIAAEKNVYRLCEIILAEAMDIPIYKLVTNWQDFAPGELGDDFQEKKAQSYTHKPDLEANAENAVLFKSLELSFENLNATGRKKLVEYANDLTKISEYNK